MEKMNKMIECRNDVDCSVHQSAIGDGTNESEGCHIAIAPKARE